MTDHTDAPDIMERMKARMERHEVGWLTWREADARAFFAEIERLRRELLDTLRNDERHVIERDEARAELGEARKHIEALLTTHLRGCVCPLFHDPARAFLDRYANPTSDKPCPRCGGCGCTHDSGITEYDGKMCGRCLGRGTER